jgi:hypothetical protein
MFIMALMTATQHVRTICCLENNDINFMCQFEVELGSHEVSNVWPRSNLGDFDSKNIG